MNVTIKFLRDGKPVKIGDFAPDTTLLNYLRLTEKSCGTKEGCAEGDCGACTVAVGKPAAGGVIYEPVNSCISLLGMMDGKDLVTVDDLATNDGLHPVQQAMVDTAGSQCGFCTPGIVMSLWCLHQHPQLATRAQVQEQLAGNLCRCTGYRPIIDAALQACAGTSTHTPPMLKPVAGDLFVGNSERFFAAPVTLESLEKLLAEHPDATLVAGATDVGLWITKQLRDLPKLVYLGKLDELQTIEDTTDILRIGAGVTYADAFEAIAAIHPDMRATLARLGSKQVRAAGTIGGNIANGSPIGDTPPLLIALGAEIVLRKAGQTRSLSLQDFFIEYGKQDMASGEYVSQIRIPKLRPNEHFRAFKISKRFDQDITAVLGAFRITLDGTKISDARIVYGGMAGTPKRATQTENLLIGREILKDEWHPVLDMLAEDFAPLSDMRASADYRATVARNILRKALIEIAGGTDTRMVEHQENNQL